MAQLVEHILGKDEVPGPNPGSSSKQKRHTNRCAVFVWNRYSPLRIGSASAPRAAESGSVIPTEDGKARFPREGRGYFRRRRISGTLHTECLFCLKSLLPSSDRLRTRPARSGIRFGYPSPREGYFRHRRISGSTPIGVPFLFGLLLSLRTWLHEAERFAESGSVSPLKRRGSLLTRAKRANFRHRRISGIFPKARYARFGVPRGFNLSFLCTPVGCFSFTSRFFHPQSHRFAVCPGQVHLFAPRHICLQSFAVCSDQE